MKFIKCCMLLIISVLLLFTTKVSAGVDYSYSSNYYNECVSNRTCLFLCGYTNQVRTTSELVAADYNYYGSYIYYDFKSNNFFVDWYSKETQPKNAKRTTQISGNKQKNIFIEIKSSNNLINSGVCPKYSFIDTDGLTSEICLSDNASFCTEDKTNGNFGTNFKGTTSLQYNYQNHINNYFENWSPPVQSYTCDMLKNGTADLETPLVQDFSKNFLYGKSLPEFIKNSTAYIKGLEKLKNEISSLEKKCNEEIKEKFENGDITEEEYQENIRENESGANNLHGQLDSAKENILNGTGSLGNVNIDSNKATCTSLLGDPTDKVTKPPAFYLQIIFDIMKYAAILILIVFSIMDFLGAVTSQDDNAIKKAMSKLMTRMVLCLIIFIIPMVLTFIFELIGVFTPSTCGIG